jgi:molybdenum ABC transporter molybdate-binding protein
LLLGGVAAIIVLLLLLKIGGPGIEADTNKILVYCAAGLREPVERIAQQYEREFGVKVDLQYGGSNTLLSQLEIDKFSPVDLYIAADDFYVQAARTKGLAAEIMSIADMRPVVAVRRDSPHRIETLDDLLQEDVILAAANPDQAAIGRAVRQRLEAIPVGDTNRWAQVERHITQQGRGVFKPTVNDVASDVKLGSAVAGIVWDSTVAMPLFRDELRAVVLPEFEGEPTRVMLCVLNSSRQPTAALKFGRYLTACDRGLPVFQEFGLQPVEGDVWALRPEIRFFCGAVNRRSVEQLISDFEKREDVVVQTAYNGCGILTSQMKVIEGQNTDQGFPDIYMACDTYYLENVKQWFQEAANISDTEIVLAVPKGSTKIKQLADLVEPGIRVAVGEPDQCTIGALTRRLLVHAKLYDKLKQKQQQPGEVVVEKSSSALLVPDVVTSNVDVAVAYMTDVRANLDRVDVVKIDSPLNIAIQPLSIAKTSLHKHLVRRLFRRIAESPEAFETAGFHFRLKDENGQPATDTEEPDRS